MIPCTREPGGELGRPKTGETPIRHVRVGEPLWSQVVAMAAEQGKSVTAVVLDALTRHVARHRRQKQRQDG